MDGIFLQMSLPILVNQFWLCRRFMEHFSRAVTDYAFTAELLREATNCDVLSLCVCMYVCMYVYLSHSTQDTCLHNCQQFVDAVHDNWDLHFTIIGCESARYITS